jgi:hypothetical protein
MAMNIETVVCSYDLLGQLDFANTTSKWRIAKQHDGGRAALVSRLEKLGEKPPAGIMLWVVTELDDETARRVEELKAKAHDGYLAVIYTQPPPEPEPEPEPEPTDETGGDE